MAHLRLIPDWLTTLIRLVDVRVDDRVDDRVNGYLRFGSWGQVRSTWLTNLA